MWRYSLLKVSQYIHYHHHIYIKIYINKLTYVVPKILNNYSTNSKKTQRGILSGKIFFSFKMLYRCGYSSVEMEQIFHTTKKKRGIIIPLSILFYIYNMCFLLCVINPLFQYLLKFRQNPLTFLLFVSLLTLIFSFRIYYLLFFR